MKGFIIKDFLLIKGTLKTIIVVLFGFIIMLLNDMSSMSFILPLICVMMSITTFSYDDYNKWDAYAVTIPNGKRNVVISKYLFTIILILVSSFVTFILLLGCAYLKNNINLEQILGNTFGGTLATTLIMSIMYPILYKFGVEKGRLAIFIGAFGLSFILGIVLKGLEQSKISLTAINHFLNNYGLIIIPIIIIILLYISYLISKKIYANKEF